MRFSAAVLMEDEKEFKLKELEFSGDLLPYEVLVKVAATGLCHTDLAVRDRHLPVALPIVLGHEGAGIVERVGSQVSRVSIGDHVILAPSHCGVCSQCLSGHPSYCESFFQLNAGQREGRLFSYQDDEGNLINGSFFGQSSFATYSLTSENNVIKVPVDIPIENLGPLGCGFQTGAGTVLNVLQPKAGESIVVFGVGPVGLAAIMAAKAVGCTTIIAVDNFDHRLKLAQEIGATHILNSKETQIHTLTENILQSEGVDYAIDTTGKTEVINKALAVLRARGRCALVGVPSSRILELENANFNNGKSIEYVVEGDSVPELFIPRLIELNKKGLFPFEKLIRFYDFKDINKAIEDSEKGHVLKAVLKMPH